MADLRVIGIEIPLKKLGATFFRKTEIAPFGRRLVAWVRKCIVKVEERVVRSGVEDGVRPLTGVVAGYPGFCIALVSGIKSPLYLVSLKVSLLVVAE